MEKIIESIFYASRWLLAPIYFGLSLGFNFIRYKVFSGIISYFPNDSECERNRSGIGDFVLNRSCAGRRFIGYGDV